ncbi:MAG TPA: AAA family ATPase [Solirubrobacteraceae bacterium]|nr:AAA family ATPase [Solirubrobacteraceae bacterium]
MAPVREALSLCPDSGVFALVDSRAVAVLGARQVGKSTLVAQIASDEHPARLISLDDDATAEAARADPTGFIADIEGPVAIDEIQRVPELDVLRGACTAVPIAVYAARL